MLKRVLIHYIISNILKINKLILILVKRTTIAQPIETIELVDTEFFEVITDLLLIGRSGSYKLLKWLSQVIRKFVTP